MGLETYGNQTDCAHINNPFLLTSTKGLSLYQIRFKKLW